MHENTIPFAVEEFPVAVDTGLDATAVVPTVRGSWKLKYGRHSYYFMNFRAAKGLRVDVNHLDVMKPGFARLKRAMQMPDTYMSTLKCMSRRYHYDFNFLEEIMLMTVPHTATAVGRGRYVVNLWSYCGYLVVDCRERSVSYHTMEDSPSDHVLGSQQWYDPDAGELYSMSYSLGDSLRRIADPDRPVRCRLFKHEIGRGGTEEIYSGDMADYLHDIVVSADRRYCVACELGMYRKDGRGIIPSKVLVVDLTTRKRWVLDRFIVAAHAQFDPVEPDVVYFSNHNFQFEHSSVWALLKRASYKVTFRGPASVFKYRLTPEGPQALGVFTRPNFYRLTNMHVFLHRGRRVMAAMGFPDEVFLIDADDMSFIRKIRVADPRSLMHLYSKKPALIGTIAPSPDGEKLFVQTTKSFQIVDVATGASEHTRDYFYNHSCSNHMLVSSDTDWE
jgi:hypothetical protein